MNIRRLWRKPGKLGRSAKGVLAVPYLRDKLTDALPTPPLSVASPRPGNWYMLMNAVLGCCVVSGIGHVIRSVSKFLKFVFGITNAQVAAAYYALGVAQGQPGPKPDNGLSIDDALLSWTQGNVPELVTMAGQAAAFAKVDQDNLTEILQCIYVYGHVIIGVALPQSAENQFPRIWKVVPGSKIVGDHCVVLTGYDQKTRRFDLITWGARIKATFDWVTTYCDEAYVVITPEVVATGEYGPLDLASLQSDLATLAA